MAWKSLFTQCADEELRVPNVQDHRMKCLGRHPELLIHSQDPALIHSLSDSDLLHPSFSSDITSTRSSSSGPKPSLSSTSPSSVFSTRRYSWPSDRSTPSSFSPTSPSPFDKEFHPISSILAIPSVPPDPLLEESLHPVSHINQATRRPHKLYPPDNFADSSEVSIPPKSSTSDETIVSKTIASLSPRKGQKPCPRKRPPSYAKQKKERNIGIINATYAVCQGKSPSGKISPLAYPVYRISKHRFLVTATLADFHVLKALQRRSAAHKAKIRFCQQSKLSSCAHPLSCISIIMPQSVHEIMKGVSTSIQATLRAKFWQYQGDFISIRDGGSPSCKLKFSKKAKTKTRTVQPDSCLCVTGAALPFLVVEVANTETPKSVARKKHNWMQGSKDHVKILIILRIEQHPTGLRVYADVMKPQQVPSPTPENPNSFRINGQYIVQREEVFPTMSQESFEIHLTEVMPKSWDRTLVDATQKVKIELNTFYWFGQEAAEVLAEEATQRARNSPVNPNQEPKSSPASSVEEISDDEDEEMEDDDENDPDYDDNEPSMIEL
ncbi:MAG: hypothetical protein Q9222_005803 [Ikaeria aurantiellina]